MLGTQIGAKASWPFMLTPVQVDVYNPTLPQNHW